jgi:hypothetical protein
MVGAVSAFNYVGVSDYSRMASSDPADIVTFDLALEDWLGRAFQGAHIGDIAELRNERKASR